MCELHPPTRRTSATSASSGCRSRLNPDAVVLATGYVRGLELETLVSHLGVLEERGRPVVIAKRISEELSAG
jgi:hypothetical protein